MVRRISRRLGCFFILGLIGIGIYLAYPYITDLTETGFGQYVTREVPGDPDNFDPIAALPGVIDYAGENADLVSINMYFVRSDGTLELTAGYTPPPRVEYEFVREVPRPDNAPPIGVGGANTGPWYEVITIRVFNPGQWRNVTVNGSSTSYRNRGMERSARTPTTSFFGEVVALPTCSMAELWEIAMSKDAPRDAVATIEYDEKGYRFMITGMSIRLMFDQDCELAEG